MTSRWTTTRRTRGRQLLAARILLDLEVLVGVGLLLGLALGAAMARLVEAVLALAPH